MTYLEIVNNVLIRLRETSVSTVTENTYSTMAGAFVNDAKHQIDHAWDWSANRQIITVTTSASQATETLTGFGAEGKVLTAHNDTQNGPMIQKSQAWFDRQNYTTPGIEGTPDKWTFRGLDASDDSIIEMWPTPDGVYSLKFNVCIPQDTFTMDGDVLSTYPQPVILLAVAMLAEEKGETAGLNTARYFQMADKALSDNIAFDAAKHPLETIWQEV